MRKIFLLLFFFFNSNLVNAETKVAYLDIQFIMDNSKLGLKYKEEIIKYQNQISSKIKKIEDDLKKKRKRNKRSKKRPK